MLNAREKQVYDFIFNFRQKNGKVPSARQITAHLDFKSSRSAQNYITALKAKGYLIDREPETSAYALVEKSRDKNKVVNIPVLGNIAAGSPAEAFPENDAIIPMPSGFFGESLHEPLFALKVMGNSMSGDAICDGDVAVIKKQRDGFRKDDILAVRVGNNEFTLKRMVLKKNTVQLISSNPDYSPMLIPSEQVNVIGKYVGLLRRF